MPTYLLQNVTTPEMGKLVTHQVSIAIACLDNIETSWTLCSCGGMCDVCLQYMTDEQQLAVAGDKPILVFHMTMRMPEEEDDECKVQHSSLGPDWDQLHSTIPVVKYPRVITAQDQGNGKFLFLCSCGFGHRYQCVCRHIAMILLHASDKSCAGCECENIALRNTAAFAACNDVSLISRSANDWKGIMCSHVTEESLKNCPSGGEFDNDDGNDPSEETPQAAPMRRSLRQAEDDARWKQHRDAEMTKLQDHYYRVRSKLLSCKREEFFDRVARVDAHLLAAFQELGDVEDIADTTVAHRYRDDPKRKAPTPTKRTRTIARGESAPVAAAQAAAQGGGGGGEKVSATPASRYMLIHISDSEELEEILYGGASSED